MLLNIAVEHSICDHSYKEGWASCHTLYSSKDFLGEVSLFFCIGLSLYSRYSYS